MAESFDMPFFEISCKNDVNIEAALLTLTRMIRERASQNVSKMRISDILNLFNFIYASFILLQITLDEPSTQTDANIMLRNFKFKEPFNEKMKCNYC